MKENVFLPYRETGNRDYVQTRKKEQVMSFVLDKLCREFIAADAADKNPLAASPDSYEFVSDFFDRYHEKIIKKLYGRPAYSKIAKQYQEDAKNFLMVALEKIRDEAEQGKLIISQPKTEVKKTPSKPVSMGWLNEWQDKQDGNES